MRTQVRNIHVHTDYSLSVRLKWGISLCNMPGGGNSRAEHDKYVEGRLSPKAMQAHEVALRPSEKRVAPISKGNLAPKVEAFR